MAQLMEAPRRLADADLREYQEKGYLALRGRFSPLEVEGWHAECARLQALRQVIHEDNLRTRSRTLPDGRRALEKFDPVADISPVLGALARDERILGALQSLYGEEMRLFKSKLIFKGPGMGGYGMHQDFAWWQPFPAETLVSVMVAIDGADAGNGGLELFPGYHDRLLTPPGELRGISEEDVDLSTGELLQTRPGDLVLFTCLTPHRSAPNPSDGRSRRQLYLTYCAARHGDLLDAHLDHYRRYVLSGLDEAARERLFFR